MSGSSKIGFRYFIDPFGCAKNQVDAENIMAMLNNSGWTLSGADDADLIIVNSCGFIESAKQESINAVLEWRKLYPQKKILLAGCLTQRYENELKDSLIEADAFFGNSDLSGIVTEAEKAVHGFSRKGPVRERKNVCAEIIIGERPLLSLPGSAYVKISEGCDNQCSYCAIPLIRGNLKSRNISDIIEECKALLDRGITELCLIGQDLGSFGSDSDPGASGQAGAPSLASLLEKISRLDGDFWVRLLYIHPDHFPLPILENIKQDKRFLPYFDLPFQHASEKILRLMNRNGNAAKYLSLIKTIRKTLPDSVIRSTFMVGFPGEADEDFDALLDFQEKAALDWMGCFAYSREEDTQAYSMKSRVPKKTAIERKTILEERQIPITENRMDRFINRDFDVLIEEKVEGEEGLWLGRLFCHAPEVDGSAVISSDTILKPGLLAKCRVIARRGIDLEVRAF